MDEIKKFFADNGVITIMHQPWQMGLFHDHMPGKMVWYPQRGTLMRETEKGMLNMGYHETKEEVYETIQKEIRFALPEGW